MSSAASIQNAPHSLARSSSRWMLAVAVAIAALMEVIDTSIVNVALTDMQATFGATLTEIGWVVTSYTIANVIMIPLSAWMGDSFGKKRYFVVAMAGFTAASVMCGISRTLPMLIAARILQGLMGGGLLAKAQAFLFENFPIEEQGVVQAVFGVCVIAGPAIGPTLGGWLVTNYSWPWIFFINLPIGILATFMCMAYIPHDPERHGTVTVDALGIGLLIVWVGSLQIFLEQGNDNDWFDSPLIRWLGISFVVAVGLWIWRELCAKKPAVSLAVLRHRSLTAGSIYSFVLGAGLYGALFAVPIFAQQILGFTAYQTGMLLMPGALASAVMMIIMGRLVGKYDARLLIFIGEVILVSSMIMLSKMSIDTGPDGIFWPMIIRGTGTTMMFLPLSIATFGPLPKKDVSSASGFYNLTRQFGGSVGVAALATILERREAFHRAVLVENVTAFSPTAAQRIQELTHAFMAKGSSAVQATHQAMALMNTSINAQAAVLSFGDTFYLVALTFILGTPLILLLGRGQGGAENVPAID